MKLNSTQEIIEDITAGKMVVVMDDEDRENEGDLIMAASMVKPDDINYMAKHGRGLICLTLTRERCKQLNLPLMVSAGEDQHQTSFTLSIEASEGVTTGISAYDRAHTIRTAVAPNATADDIVRPGHVFPLMAQPGGVLTRAGHTEAGCDLARLAGLEPAAVIVEIMNDDGTMARRPQLEQFAIQHQLKIGTIEDLIRYRVRHERTVKKVAEQEFMTAFGRFTLVTYRDVVNKQIHFALVRGNPEECDSTLVRVHLENTLCDTLLGAHPNFGWPLSDALQRIANEDNGVAVVLRVGNDINQLMSQLQMIDVPSTSMQKIEHTHTVDRRTLGIGGQILADLGVHKMRLLSAPQTFHGLGGFGLTIVEYITGEDNKYGIQPNTRG